jgi:ketosteroid isomerase-like protein
MKTLVALIVLSLMVTASGSVDKKGKKAVSIARSHIEAWSNHDYETARTLLAPDVHVTVTTTQPMMVRTDTTGVDQYMSGLEKFAQAVKTGSAQIIESSSDDKNALIVVKVRAVFGPPGAQEVTVTQARLYLLDDNDKIKTEQVIFYASSE